MSKYIPRKHNHHPSAWLIKKILSVPTKKVSAQVSSQSGFSLVESLVAVVVVSVLLTGIAPFLALTFGQRVQARRIDQATQAARTYIEGVRSGTIPVPNDPANNATAAQFGTSNLNVAVLTALPDQTLSPSTLISTDGTAFSTSNPQHLVIQAIRSACIPVAPAITCDNTIGANVRQQGYRLSVRVYRADAFNSAGVPVSPLQLPFISGGSVLQSPSTATLGSRSRPLVVMQSDIIASGVNGSVGTSFTDYQTRFP
jgi:prepilin-type N-terminal cleavage/methylation domain-containing protein